jgi:hypothetical protein
MSNKLIQTWSQHGRSSVCKWHNGHPLLTALLMAMLLFCSCCRPSAAVADWLCMFELWLLMPATSAPAHAALLDQVMWDDVSERMQELGFERGWGRDVGLMREQFRQLLDILQVGRCGCQEAKGNGHWQERKV